MSVACCSVILVYLAKAPVPRTGEGSFGTPKLRAFGRAAPWRKPNLRKADHDRMLIHACIVRDDSCRVP